MQKPFLISFCSAPLITTIISCDWEIIENRKGLAWFLLLNDGLNDPIHVVPLPGRLPFTKILNPRLHFLFCGYGGLVSCRIVIQRHKPSSKPKNRSPVLSVVSSKIHCVLRLDIMNFEGNPPSLLSLVSPVQLKSTEHGIHPETPSESIIVTATCLLLISWIGRWEGGKTYKEPYSKKSITKSTCPLHDVIRLNTWARFYSSNMPDEEEMWNERQGRSTPSSSCNHYQAWDHSKEKKTRGRGRKAEIFQLT